MADLLIETDHLSVTISPSFGGSITGITHRPSGQNVLWATTWAQDVDPPARDRPLGVDEWVEHSRGGWQTAFPNGGDAAEFAGVRHGFHGEASVADWSIGPIRLSGDGIDATQSVELATTLTTLNTAILRTILVRASEVSVFDRIKNLGADAVEVMWTQHPGLGGALLDGASRLDTNARAVRFDDRAPVVGLPVSPGTEGSWPYIGTNSSVDLRRPLDGSAFLAYLSDFDGDPWVSLNRVDGSIGVRLTWPAQVFPHCWLWQELGGTLGAPWNGTARVIGVEPATSWPGQGLSTVAATTKTTVELAAGATIAAGVTLAVSTEI